MEFIKKFFKDDDYIVGLTGFKGEQSLPCKREGDRKAVEGFNPSYNIFTPPKNLVFYTNTKNNFLLS